MKLSVIIVDDEMLARAYTRALVEENSQWTIIGEYDNGSSALAGIKQDEPDLVFVDIQMPKMDGISLAKSLVRLKKPPIVIFITAYERYAVDAFEVAAIDYLLKPVDEERMGKLITRINDYLSDQGNHNHTDRLSIWHDAKKEQSYLEKLVVRSVGRYQFIRVDQLRWIRSSGNYIELHTHEKSLLHRASMQYMEDHLDPREFIRIHRTTIIRIDEVTEIKRASNGKLSLILTQGECMPVSDGYREQLEKRLQIDI